MSGLNRTSKKGKDMGDTFDRLSGLDIDSDRSVDLDKPNLDIRKNKDLNDFLMQGSKAPRTFDVMSEIEDPKEKDKVFDHSVKNSLFRNINQSPLRERMPRSMQMYKEETLGQSNFNASMRNSKGEAGHNLIPAAERLRAKENGLVGEGDKENKEGLDIGCDFNFQPRKFYCKNHPSFEIEYCNEISGNFYCRMCRAKYSNQDDKVLSVICADIQQRMTDLKMNYTKKKQTLVAKIDRNQDRIEELFKFYYDTLD
jgi:hypothetical protein